MRNTFSNTLSFILILYGNGLKDKYTINDTYEFSKALLNHLITSKFLAEVDFV